MRALQAVRRGLLIAQESGNRANESHLAICLSVLEAEHGDPLAAFDCVMLAIRNFQDSGHAANMRVAQAMLAVLRAAPTVRTGGPHCRFRVPCPDRSAS